MIWLAFLAEVLVMLAIVSSRRRWLAALPSRAWRTSVGDGVYWAITTMTTAGYGDINAGTPEGKVIAITVMLVGIGFAALVIGAIAERFTNRHAHAVELTDEDLVKHVQETSTRLQILERVLLQRQPGDSPPTHARPAPERSA